jgi:predicted outer membrane repeat protein
MGEYTTEIDFSGKEVIIFGNNATLDAGGKGRFFVGDGSRRATSLELHDMTLQNGKHNTRGGAISMIEGILITKATKFERNFVGSLAGPKSAEGPISAGAIYAAGTRVEIRSSQFNSNQASGEGGAISVNSGSLVIHDTSFESNTANLRGGAIFARNGTDTEVDACTFRANTATGQNGVGGGAILVDGGLLVVRSTTFETNGVLGGRVAYGGGGAIGVSNYLGDTAGVTNVEMYDSVFTANIATSGNGGAIYSDAALFGSKMTICTCTFHANSAGQYGGAIYSDTYGGVLVIHDTRFEANQVRGVAAFGGAIYFIDGECEIQLCVRL